MSSTYDQTLRVALIGSGYWGRNIGRTLGELGVLAAVADADTDAARRLTDQHGGNVMTFDEILADQSISAIAIATPAATHFDLTRTALLGGKDVFVEKPMSLRPEHGRELIRIAARENRVLMVGHLLQYHSGFRALKELIRTGHLGRLRYVYSHRLNFGKIRREEDILWSFAPHDLSMILSIAGEEPQTVDCIGTFALHERIADVTTTHLTFPSSLKAHVFVSWLHPSKEQRLVVIGDKAMAIFDDRRPWEEKLAVYDSSITWVDGQPLATPAEPTYIPVPTSEPLADEMTHFLHCLSTRSTPRTDGEEGLAVLNVLHRAADSMLSHRVTESTNGLRSSVDPSAAPLVTASEVPDGVHPTAIIDPGASVGENTKIWHFSHVLGNSHVGANCSLGQNVVVGPNVSIGDGCKIQNNVSVYDGVTLEDDVFCGPSMVFTNVITPRAFVNRKEEFAPTLVKRGASIGANATIICGRVIGSYALIGAGAVVTKDVPDFALVIGNPARQIGWVSREGEVLNDDLVCPRTGEQYELIDGALRPKA